MHTVGLIIISTCDDESHRYRPLDTKIVRGYSQRRDKYQAHTQAHSYALRENILVVVVGLHQ